VDLGAGADSLLSELSSELGVSKSDLFKNALASYAFLMELTCGDRKLSITNSRDEVLKDVLLPGFQNRRRNCLDETSGPTGELTHSGGRPDG